MCLIYCQIFLSTMMSFIFLSYIPLFLRHLIHFASGYLQQWKNHQSGLHACSCMFFMLPFSIDHIDGHFHVTFGQHSTCISTADVESCLFTVCWMLRQLLTVVDAPFEKPRMSYWMTIQLGVIILMQIFCNCWWSSLSLFLLMAFIIFKHIKLWESSEKMNWFDFLFVTLLLHMLPLFPVATLILLQCCQCLVWSSVVCCYMYYLLLIWQAGCSFIM